MIDSESYRCEVKIRQIEARIAANSQSISKVGNDELAYLNEQMLIHESIKGSSNLTLFSAVGVVSLSNFTFRSCFALHANNINLPALTTMRT